MRSTILKREEAIAFAAAFNLLMRPKGLAQWWEDPERQASTITIQMGSKPPLNLTNLSAVKSYLRYLLTDWEYAHG